MELRKENTPDELFKQGLADGEGHHVFSSYDWDAMEILLNERKKRRGIIYYMPRVAAGIAALLLLTLGFFFLKPAQAPRHNNAVAKHNPGQQPKVQLLPETHERSPNVLRKATTAFTTARNGSTIKVATPNIYNTANPDTVPNKVVIGNLQNSTSTVAAVSAVNTTAVNQDSIQQTVAAVTGVQTPDTITTASSTVTTVKEKPSLKPKLPGYKPVLAVTVVAAPDFNGVGSAFNRTQIGTNAGLMLSVGVTKKLTVSTGALYAKKPYNIGFGQYYTVFKFSVQPTDVNADCRVLDIPLNIDYRVYHKGRDQFSIGTGISSYFMLRENYHFNYNGGVPQGPTDYNIQNQNKHILGVLNLNATYQRRINGKFGLNVQPYMKLPLTNIGYGRVNLQSTGVAVGASWFLNNTSKK